MKPEVLELVHRATIIQGMLENVKPLYKELDDIVDAIKASGEEVLDTPTHHVWMVDNFADKNTVWKSCGVKRWELKIDKKKS